MGGAEQAVFLASTLLTLGDDDWAALPRALLLCVGASAALCAAFRPSWLFPCMLAVSLTRHEPQLCWDALTCAGLFAARETAGWAPAWLLAVVRPTAGLGYLVCLEALRGAPLLRGALSPPEHHLMACLVLALARHVVLWPADDLSLAALPVLALLAMGVMLSWTEGRARSLPRFAALSALCVAVTLGAARLLAGHWMLQWAWGRLTAYGSVGTGAVALLLGGLLLIVLAVRNHQQGAALGVSHRKLFHALIVAIFSYAVLQWPPALWMPALTLASLAALCALLLVELARSLSGDNALARGLNAWYGRWIDDRDSGALIATTHIQLLLGCAVPVMLARGSVAVAVCGLVSIGVGDSMAAVVGSNWGRVHWSPHNRRTVEGTAAMALSMVAAFAVLAPQLPGLAAVRVSVCVALMEAVTHTRDNLLLPLFAASLLQ